MVVALNSDTSVKRLGKGNDRPVNTLADRLAVMAALECVSLVTWFDEDTPLERILECRPDVLVKGGVKGIWNFAPTDITVPKDVALEAVHLSDSLLTLVYLMNEKNPEYHHKDENIEK